MFINYVSTNGKEVSLLARVLCARCVLFFTNTVVFHFQEDMELVTFLESRSSVFPVSGQINFIVLRVLA